MSTREILTLQFGHYANFVGTHWWNLQESSFDYNSSEPSEINHGVLYREGLTAKGQVTFTPRLLLVDLKGSLGSLLKEGDLYDQGRALPEWDAAKVEVQQCPKVAKNEFQTDLENPEVSSRKYDLSSQVNVWSDYLYTRFHPRSVNVVNEYQHCNSETPFDSFSSGSSVWGSEFEDEFSDKIRQYIEECDHFQGFQVLTDCTNGFAGLSSACLEHIADEFDRKSVLVFPTIPSFFPDSEFESDEERVYSLMNDSVRVVNLLLGFNSFTKFSSTFVPLCLGENGWRQPGAAKQFYHTRYNAKLPYHSSGILGAALDTMTSVYRLRGSHFGLADLCADLGANGRKAACAGLCLPFSLNSDADLIDCLDRWEGPLLKSITPRCSIETERAMQHLTLRGVGENRLKSAQRGMEAYKCETVREMLEFYLSCTGYATASHVTVLRKPLPTKNPFPDIFDEWIGVEGDVTATSRLEHLRVNSVPVLAGFQTSGGVGSMLGSLYAEAKKLKVQRFHQFSLTRDEYEECLNDILTLQESYEDSYFI